MSIRSLILPVKSFYYIRQVVWCVVIYHAFEFKRRSGRRNKKSTLVQVI